MMQKIFVSQTKGLAIGQALVFDCEWNGSKHQGFVLKSPQGLVAYLNQCMHIPVSLDFDDADFWHSGIERIMCKTHGATFRPEDGLCDSGPCTGRKLIQFTLEEEASGGDGVWVNVG
jgi:nitrite reductase/ring-hydroxylating ferredoxin subunit